ncbi:hypothetical protein [Streptomyces albogriseolus]|uniref:hypothetical protein n=1 Tax=Streptomyces albogriseolus TaxID=1887 RepID=UPI0033A1FF26
MSRRKVGAMPVLGGEERGVGGLSEADFPTGADSLTEEEFRVEERIRRTAVSFLFRALSHGVRVRVRDGVVTSEAHIRDSSLVSLAVRLARAVEGVVDVRPRLTGASADRWE